MKKIFLISLIFSNLSYSQIKSNNIISNNLNPDTILHFMHKGAKMSKHTVDLEKQFKFGKFTFDSKWDDLKYWF